jgi:hypothetical protein
MTGIECRKRLDAPRREQVEKPLGAANTVAGLGWVEKKRL